jgi:hypothetical protein
MQVFLEDLMNYLIKKDYFKNLICKIALLTSIPLSVQAGMRYVPQAEVSVIKLVNFLKSKKSNEGSEKLTLLLIAKDVLNLKSFTIVSEKSKITILEKKVTIGEITTAMTNQMFKIKSWKKAIPTRSLALINSNIKVIEKHFGPNSYGWAWFLFKNGDKKSSKKTLESLHHAQFESIMNIERLHFRWSGSELFEFKQTSQALLTISNDREKKVIMKKDHRAKIHFSNLPQSNIQT